MAGMTFGGRKLGNYGWVRFLSGMVTLVGVWQLAAPFVLNFAQEPVALRNAVATGVLLTLFGALAVVGAGRWSRRTVGAFDGLAALTGMWLLISPWVSGYQAIVPAFWSAIVAGLGGCIAAGLAAVQQQQESLA